MNLTIDTIDIFALVVLWCIVALFAGMLIGSFIRAGGREYEPKLEGRPTEPPPPPTVITSYDTPRASGIYRTQYSTHGLLVTEYKFWNGEKWCDTVQRNYVSPFQSRTWEMI